MTEPMSIEELTAIADKVDEFRNSHKEEVAEVRVMEREVGASLMAKLCMKQPMGILMAEELVALSRYMFWLGYYTKATRVEVPEEIKKAFNGGPQ